MVTNNDTQTVQTDLFTLSTLEQKDRIKILLSEYSTLRSEILSRTGYGFQIATVAAAVLTWLLQQPFSHGPWYFWLVMAGIAASFSISIFVNVRDLTRAAHRVRELEHEINSRAGEHLLVWETLSGVLTRMSLIRSFFSMVRPLPRSKLPPLEPFFLQRNARDSN